MPDERLIRLIIADDHALLRQGLRRVLEMEPDLVVVGEAADGLSAVEMAKQVRPDVLLVDISMPGLDGVEVTRQVKRDVPSCAVIAITIHDGESYLFNVVRAGGQGYLLKDSDPDTIVTAIRTAAAGGSYFPASLMTSLVGDYRRLSDEAAAAVEPGSRGWHLTDREIEILRCLAQGFSNREIGEHLFIAEKTVKNHVSNLLKKLGLADRTQAALFAVKHRLVKLD